MVKKVPANKKKNFVHREELLFCKLGLDEVDFMFSLLSEACEVKYKKQGILRKIQQISESSSSNYLRLDPLRKLMNFPHKQELFLLYLLSNWLEINLQFENERSIYKILFSLGFASTLQVDRSISIDTILSILPNKPLPKNAFIINLFASVDLLLGNLLSLNYNTDDDKISTFFKLKKTAKYKPIVPKSDMNILSSINARIIPLNNDYDLVKKLDIDGIFGYKSIDEAHLMFKSSINVNLVDEKDHLRIRKNSIFVNDVGFIKLSRCTDIKIGFIHTSFGILDVILIIYEAEYKSKSQNNILRKKYLHMLLEYCNGSEHISLSPIQREVVDEIKPPKTLLKGVLGLHSIKEFFNGFKKILAGKFAFIYIETFGNKNQATCPLTSYTELISRLHDVINIDMMPSLKVDICITISSKESCILIGNSSFYNELELMPNYKLLLSNDMANYHDYNFNVNKEYKLEYISKMFDKLNCYSTFEDLISQERKLKFIPRYAAALIKESLYGHRLGNTTVSRRRILEKMHKLKTICSEKSAKNLDFRVECRVFPFQIELALNYLNGLCKPTNFSIINYNQFTEIFETSLDLFIGNIQFGCANYLNADTCHTFERVAWTVVSEILLLSRYLSGNPNTHQVKMRSNTIFKDDEYFSNGCIKIPSVDKIVMRIITEYSNPDEILMNLINSIYNLDESFKKNMLSLIKFWKAFNPAKAFIDLYYKLRSDYKYENYSHISDLNIDDTQLNNIYFTQWIQKNFNQTSLEKKSNFLRCAFDILRLKYGGSDSIAIDNLKNEIRDCEIKIVYYESYKPSSTDSGYNIFAYLLLDSYRERERSRLLTLLYKLVNNKFSTNVRCNEEEMARIIHGWYYYRSTTNKHQFVLGNFVYGFTLIRNFNWVKNRRTLFKQYFEKGRTLRKLINMARGFRTEVFDMAELQVYFKSLRKENLSDEAIDLYSQIRMLDIEKMNDENMFECIANATDEEILSSFLSKDEVIQALRVLNDLPISEAEDNRTGVQIRERQHRSVNHDDHQAVLNPAQEYITYNQFDVHREPGYISEMKEILVKLEQKMSELQLVNNQIRQELNDALVKVHSSRPTEPTVVDQASIPTSFDDLKDENYSLVDQVNDDMFEDDFDDTFRSEHAAEENPVIANVAADLHRLSDIRIKPLDDGQLDLDKTIFFENINRVFGETQLFTVSKAMKYCIHKDSGISKIEVSNKLNALVEDGKLHSYKGPNLHSITKYAILETCLNPEDKSNVYERIKKFYINSGNKPFTSGQIRRNLFCGKGRITRSELESLLDAYVEDKRLYGTAAGTGPRRYTFERQN